jgi:hypothetical protein
MKINNSLEIVEINGNQVPSSDNKPMLVIENGKYGSDGYVVISFKGGGFENQNMKYAVRGNELMRAVENSMNVGFSKGLS